MKNQPLSALPILACMLVLAGTAGAQSIEQARCAQAEGRFLEAAGLAQVADTSEGYALAANAVAIYGHYLAADDEKMGLFERAEELARRAIQRDPGNPEAHLQLAHALGRRAQLSGALKALNEGYATKVREIVEEALRLDPDRATAHLILGAWHAEAVSSGGFLAGMLYGANGKDAVAHFERALELAPQDMSVLFDYALGLLNLDADDRHGKARDLLQRMIDMAPQDAYQQIIQRVAVERMAALDGR